MNGIKHIKVYNNKGFSYTMDIKRKITIISDNSGTGKSTLVSMIEEANISAGAFLDCECPCRILTDRNWKRDIEELSNTIIFVDENFEDINTREFADAVNNSDNYFVIINREKLDKLAISYKEIYTIKSSGKFHTLEQKYKDFTENRVDGVDISWVLVEDSNSGFEFFSKMCHRYNTMCTSAKGKSNIKRCLTEVRRLYTGNILIICDGAAIGAEMSQLSSILQYGGIYIIMNESFEFMLLHSEMFKRNKYIVDILRNPYKYITTEYISFERFYKDLISKETMNTGAQYGKSKLNRCYVEKCCFRDKNCKYYCKVDKIQDIMDKFFKGITFIPLDYDKLLISKEVLEANEIMCMINKAKMTKPI